MDHDENDSGEGDPDLLALTANDGALLKYVEEICRERLSRPYLLPPEELVAYGHMLHAIESAPRICPEICVEITIQFRQGGAMEYIEFRYAYDTFSVSEGRHSYEPGVGGDSDTELLFCVGTEGYREGSYSTESIRERVRELREMGAWTEIKDESVGAISPPDED